MNINPKYSLMETISAVLQIATKALEEVRTLARIPGEKGEQGEAGLGFEDMDIEYDGERTFTLKFARDGKVKEKSFKMPVMIYRGVYDEAKRYDTGDTVTWAGCSWVLKGEANDKPGKPNSGWQMSVKAGRDGRDREVKQLSNPSHSVSLNGRG